MATALKPYESGPPHHSASEKEPQFPATVQGGAIEVCPAVGWETPGKAAEWQDTELKKTGARMTQNNKIYDLHY